MLNIIFNLQCSQKIQPNSEFNKITEFPTKNVFNFIMNELNKITNNINNINKKIEAEKGKLKFKGIDNEDLLTISSFFTKFNQFKSDLFENEIIIKLLLTLFDDIKLKQNIIEEIKKTSVELLNAKEDIQKNRKVAKEIINDSKGLSQKLQQDIEKKEKLDKKKAKLDQKNLIFSQQFDQLIKSAEQFSIPLSNKKIDEALQKTIINTPIFDLINNNAEKVGSMINEAKQNTQENNLFSSLGDMFDKIMLQLTREQQNFFEQMEQDLNDPNQNTEDLLKKLHTGCAEMKQNLTKEQKEPNIKLDFTPAENVAARFLLKQNNKNQNNNKKN